LRRLDIQRRQESDDRVVRGDRNESFLP
jgi:hypothetical protein